MNFRNYRIAYVLVIVIAAIAFAILFEKTNELSQEQARTLETIQINRHEYLLWECKDVNARNRASHAFLNSYALTEEGVAFVQRFIDVSLPIRDCKELARIFAPGPN